ncbi:unnamed protein product [Prunus armeniaca]
MKNPDGSVSRYKARLVAQGFSQEQGLDYDETFSPVVRHTTVRLVLALAAANHWELRQLDVKNDFLHGDLQEEIYMKQPQGFEDAIHPSYVCKLLKSLYGLKQAPRAWNAKFTSYLPILCFILSHSNSSLFVKHTGTNIVLLLLYVVDIIVTSSSSTLVQSVITDLGEAFNMKDMGKLTFFLGLEILYLSNGDIFANQAKYLRDLLKKAAMVECKPCSTPAKPHQQFLKDEGDIQLLVYSDSDWAGDPNTRRSTTGYVVYLGNNPIPWQSRKQNYVSRSSTYAEYKALANSAYEFSWIRQILKDMHLFLAAPPILQCDNLSALALSSNPVFHSRIKHLDTDFHFVRERVQHGDIHVQYVPTQEQVANMLTKGLHSPVFLQHCSNLKLGPLA